MANINQKIKKYISVKYNKQKLSIKLRFNREPQNVNLETRLAKTKQEIRAAQQLRFRVFYKELSANPSLLTRFTRRDRDTFDKICDHMLVIDHSNKKKGVLLIGKKRENVVGTYRLLPQRDAEINGGFYSQDEYNLAPLLEKHPNKKFLELGRSCVLKTYRKKSTIEFLWQGVWTYIEENNFDVMIGCASFQATDPKEIALPLSFLYHNSLAPDEWRVRANSSRFVNMNMINKDQIDSREALKKMPPLLKGYLRLGAYIGDGAVIDKQFGTIDVFVVMPRNKVEKRFVDKFTIK
ncbi:MAG: GNAT family N-acyltransferase [Hyphomicrobiales bacterium]|jgi:L-ornithine Nalpha-acyltransferase|nr:GNAT family N-acyltransferase [Hyphomicrobiales bacterium]|tara:strand:- start:185 stop:1066 length:882 start_codon:yes stop_codon:yes gene_type:complete